MSQIMKILACRSRVDLAALVQTFVLNLTLFPGLGRLLSIDVSQHYSTLMLSCNITPSIRSFSISLSIVQMHNHARTNRQTAEGTEKCPAECARGLVPPNLVLCSARVLTSHQHELMFYWFKQITECSQKRILRPSVFTSQLSKLLFLALEESPCCVFLKCKYTEDQKISVL